MSRAQGLNWLHTGLRRKGIRPDLTALLPPIADASSGPLELIICSRAPIAEEARSIQHNTSCFSDIWRAKLATMGAASNLNGSHRQPLPRVDTVSLAVYIVDRE
jgi:hypothetical protein